jgi:hypothetical protein
VNRDCYPCLWQIVATIQAAQRKWSKLTAARELIRAIG